MIRFPSSAYDDLVWGRKKAIFCLSGSAPARWIASGELHNVLVAGKRVGTARILRLQSRLLDDWAVEDLVHAGFQSTEELRIFLSRRYKTFNPEKQVVGIFFEMATLSSVF